MPTNECFDFKYVFIVSVDSVSELFAFCFLYSSRFKECSTEWNIRRSREKKTCWPNFHIEIRKFCFSVESFALFVDLKDLSNVPFRREQMQRHHFEYKPRKFVTYFHTQIEHFFLHHGERSLYHSCGVQSDATSAMKVHWIESKDAKMLITKSLHWTENVLFVGC